MILKHRTLKLVNRLYCVKSDPVIWNHREFWVKTPLFLVSQVAEDHEMLEKMPPFPVKFRTMIRTQTVKLWHYRAHNITQMVRSFRYLLYEKLVGIIYSQESITNQYLGNTANSLWPSNWSQQECKHIKPVLSCFSSIYRRIPSC